MAVKGPEACRQSGCLVPCLSTTADWNHILSSVSLQVRLKSIWIPALRCWAHKSIHSFNWATLSWMIGLYLAAMCHLMVDTWQGRVPGKAMEVIKLAVSLRSCPGPAPKMLMS